MAFCVSYRLRLYAAILHVIGEWKGDRVARIGKLKAVEVAKAKGPKVLHDGGGLCLRVASNRRDADGNEKPGSKAWVFRFQLDGKRRDMGLWPYPDISLAEARQRATDCRKQRTIIDPLHAKLTQRQAQRLAVANGRTFWAWPRSSSRVRKLGGAILSTASNGVARSLLTP